jgi:hypothetical protein
MKSRIESEEPNLLIPYTERLDPNLENPRNESEEEHCVKSRTERLEPKLVIPYKDRELPTLKSPRQLIELPNEM